MKRRRDVMKRIRQLIRREDGGALAELAILVPFLAVMLAGVCEFGRYFQNYNTLSKATRTAARYMSNHKVTAAEIDRRAAAVRNAECLPFLRQRDVESELLLVHRKRLPSIGTKVRNQQQPVFIRGPLLTPANPE